MGHIRNTILGIDVSSDKDRQMMIELYDRLVWRLPLFAYRVNKHATEHYLPVNRHRSNPFFARTREELSPSALVQRNAYELPDGWFAHLNADAYGYKHILTCIEDTFDIKFDVEFNN